MSQHYAATQRGATCTVLRGSAALDGRHAGPTGSNVLYVRINSWWPSVSDLDGSPCATFTVTSNTSRPTSSSVARPSSIRPASTSMSPDRLRYVSGFAQTLMTGEIAEPTTEPRPVVNRIRCEPHAINS